MPYHKSPSDIRRALGNQISAIRSSCEAFDRGERWEAPRIAVAISMICHHTRRSVSLLQHLQLEDRIKFISTVSEPISNTNLCESHPLVGIEIGLSHGETWPAFEGPPGGEWNPIFHRECNFEKWWKHEIIAAGRLGSWSLTRHGLIQSMRDQDGGAHVDEKLSNEAYIAYSRAVNWRAVSEGNRPKDIVEFELCTARQIGWEILKSFERAGEIGTA